MKKFIERFALKAIGLIYKLLYYSICRLPMVELYQPVFGSKVGTGLTRVCVDRWEAIEPHLPEKKGAILDIGLLDISKVDFC